MELTGTAVAADLDGLIGAFLRAVSFAEGERPGYDDIPGLFVAGGLLTRAVSGAPEIMTVDGFIAPRRAAFDAGDLTSFEEYEIAQVTRAFGNVAHRFSSYGKRGVTRGMLFESVGMISTQFVRTPDGWRISAMAWDDERPGLRVPFRYRPTV